MGNTKICEMVELPASNGNVPVRLIISKNNWLETDALDQLQRVAQFPGMCAAFGLPDLHPGKGHPIGAAFVSRAVVYPHLVGSDIGCGRGLWQLDVRAHKINSAQWERKLKGLDDNWSGDANAWLETFGLDATQATPQQNSKLGTIGGGNHFAEVQAVQQVFDAGALAACGLDKNSVVLLAHSGSRGLGQDILTQYIEAFGSAGLLTEQAQAYVNQHNFADAWAAANRALIAHRFASALRLGVRPLLDVSHNHVRPLRPVEAETLQLDVQAGEHYWLHRKGASPSTEGLVMIPGSRGSLSYLVQPRSQDLPALAQAGFSVAHGAGRKWKRSDCKARLLKHQQVKDLESTAFGSRIICKHRDLLFEEAPQAYKNIDRVVADLVAAGLIDLVASFKPVLTYKTMRKAS